MGEPGDRYPLSPKDMCTVELLPEIVKSGIMSLKIEGRMKKPEYTAGVVSIYRKYLDLYEKKPSRFHVLPEDMKKLYFPLSALKNAGWPGYRVRKPEIGSFASVSI